MKKKPQNKASVPQKIFFTLQTALHASLASQQETINTQININPQKEAFLNHNS